jgi:hypothetical protein
MIVVQFGIWLEDDDVAATCYQDKLTALCVVDARVRARIWWYMLKLSTEIGLAGH